MQTEHGSGRRPRIAVARDVDGRVILATLPSAFVGGACARVRHGNWSVSSLVGLIGLFGNVTIEVADECGGLPPGKAEELFRPFEQRGEARSEDPEGLRV